MKAVGYCRVSSQEQVDGTSLKAQEEQIRAYATMKRINLAAVLVDGGISGGKALAARPEGARLAEMVDSGEVQAVIITKLDRGFRSASDCLNNVEAWERRKVALHILVLLHPATSKITSSSTGAPSGRLATPYTKRQGFLSFPKTSCSNSEAPSATFG